MLREFAVGLLFFVAVVISRHLTWDFPIELSGDESELLVQIGRYERDPVPWRSVDGSTIGPLTPWFLVVMKAAGWPMNYGSLHLLGALLLGVITVVGYSTVRMLLPFRLAVWIGGAGTFAVACASSINFMYYATELLPALLLGLSVLALAWVWARAHASLPGLSFAALVAGMAPWAKLQSAPIALLICVATAAMAWFHCGVPFSTGRRVGRLAAVVVAALLPTAMMVALVAAAGIFDDFWASYIVANLGYAGDFGPRAAAARLGILLYWSQLNGLMAAVAALGVLLLLRVRRSGRAGVAAGRSVRVFAFLYLAVTVYCCIRPPHGFGHYHLFLIGPILLMLGVLLQDAVGVMARVDGRGIRRPWLAPMLSLLLPVFLVSGYNYVSGESLRQRLREMRARADLDLPGVVTREIRRLAPEAADMVVWGWMPTLYVRSGLSSATRHTISHFLIDPGPSRERLRRQFMDDVIRSQPDVVVDAVASDCFVWNWDVPSSGIESFPEFAAYVRENYTLALNVIGDREGVPLRVFVRRDPAAEVE